MIEESAIVALPTRKVLTGKKCEHRVYPVHLNGVVEPFTKTISAVVSAQIMKYIVALACNICFIAFILNPLLLATLY